MRISDWIQTCALPISSATVPAPSLMVPLHSASDLRVIIGGSREMKQPRWDVSTTSWRATISAILLMQQEAGGSAAWPARFSMSRQPGVPATHEAVQVRQRKGVVTSAVPTMDAVDRLNL